jgi:hypothetical protein
MAIELGLADTASRADGRDSAAIYLEPARKFGSCPEHLTEAASIDFAGRSESGRRRLGLR